MDAIIDYEPKLMRQKGFNHTDIVDFIQEPLIVRQKAFIINHNKYFEEEIVMRSCHKQSILYEEPLIVRQNAFNITTNN
tara:strand:+ start:168 stop:404 length:237 start_codon:yes stop_codon:yes gene_type:complete